MALWKMRFARLGEDLLRIPGQRFFRFRKEIAMTHPWLNSVQKAKQL